MKLLGLVLFAVMLFGMCSVIHAPPATAQTPIGVKVGTFVYCWYDPSRADSWQYPKVVDKPVLGFYDSSNPKIVATQIKWIDDLGIDFVMLNWLGVGTFSDKTVSVWYQVAKAKTGQLKLSIMIEPYNEGGTYNYKQIYDRAYALYRAYPNVSLVVNSKPVIFFYNGVTLTGNTTLTLPLDSRFTVMTVGHRGYVDFWYDDIRNFVPTSIPHRDQISVLPRFDDSRQYAMGLRDHVNVVDANLTEGLYQSQWERAISFANNGTINWITIASFNEYPERTAIEPAYDATAHVNPYYLYNMTKEYIIQLRTQLPAPEFPTILFMPLVMAFVIVFLRKRKVPEPSGVNQK